MLLFFGFGTVRGRLLLVSLALIGTGAWMFAPTWNASKQVDCNINHLAAGKLPDSNWVRVSGRLLWDQAGTEEKRGHIRAYFVPLVSGSWNENQPVPVIVRINEFDADEMRDAGTVEGLIQPLGLPFDLRLAFSGSDGPKAAENVVYIHHGTNPKSQRKFSLVVLAIGFTGLIVSLVLAKNAKDDRDTGYHSRAQSRDLNEAISRTDEQEEEHRLREAQRDSEVDRWMRERGLKTSEASPQPHEPAAAH